MRRVPGQRLGQLHYRPDGWLRRRRGALTGQPASAREPHQPSRADDPRIDALCDQLIGEFPPSSTPPGVFWGAQFDLGLAWVHFPAGYGGLGADPSVQERVDDRLHQRGAPSNRLRNLIGIGMAAPTLLAYGGPEERSLLRPIFCCEDIWCQMFSEPGAGSDLASLSTRAVRDGVEWVINGQKVWTTLAHVANRGLLLARTDPDAPKHQGLTYFHVDMQWAGIDVQPLRQMSGEAEFNQVFLTDVRVPDAHRLGQVGQGWQVALATLMNERFAVGELTRDGRGSGSIRHAVRLFRSAGRPDPVARQRLAEVWIDAEIARLTLLRTQALRSKGTPGPEGSILRLLAGRLQQETYDLCVDLLGPRGMLISNYDIVQPAAALETAIGTADDVDVVKAFLAARGITIGGGTTEIALNIIGERVLGLPAEDRPDKHVPWRLVPRS